MKAEERRRAIIKQLADSPCAVSGGALAEKLGASRQIIVQDISVLKASGYDILSTHSGYILKGGNLKERVFKLRHTSEQTFDELSAIIQYGGTVADVFVWHKAYGKVTVQLNISTPKDVEDFMYAIKTGKSSELMHITDGYHYHTVRAETEDILDNIANILEKKGYTVEEKC